MFVIQLLYAPLGSDGFIYYIANVGGVRKVVSESGLNDARIYKSKKLVNEAIKSYKDGFKAITRKNKSPLVCFDLYEGIPESYQNIALDINDFSLTFKEVQLVIVD